MLAKMARSAPSAAVRSVNGDDSRPRRQPGLPKRGENAKIRGGSEFIRRIPVYVNFGGVSTTLTTNLAGAAVPNTMTTSAKLSASIARLGLNYKF